jgi:hypothetical protein
MSLFVFFISLLIVVEHVSGNHVPIIRSWRSWQPSRSHGTYQNEAITSRSRQLLMMDTWLLETCWATIRREIKNTKVACSWFFLSTLRKVFSLFSRRKNCSAFHKYMYSVWTSNKLIVYYFYTYIFNFVLYFFLFKWLCWMVTLL